MEEPIAPQIDRFAHARCVYRLRGAESAQKQQETNQAGGSHKADDNVVFPSFEFRAASGGSRVMYGR